MGGKQGGDKISARIGKNANLVAVGKNITQIQIQFAGRFFPFWYLLAILGVILLAAGVAFAIYYLHLPTQMPGTFNVAIAEFGQADSQGNGQSSANGRLLSKYLYTDINTYLENLPVDVRLTMIPSVWQDDSGDPKRVSIGVIPGNTPQARTLAACAKANAVLANVIIYGNLPADPAQAFTPEFAICKASLKFDADQLIGAHNLRQGIQGSLLAQLNDILARNAANKQIADLGNTLSGLTIGILYDLQGDPARSLVQFNNVLSLETAGTGQANDEVLYFFIGRENLMLKNYAGAQKNFASAIGINPAYPLAHLGLGSVYFARAQLPDEPSPTADLQKAIGEYTTAVSLSNNAPGSLVGPLARLGLASTNLLLGSAAQDKDPVTAATDYQKAVTDIGPIVQALGQSEQYRVLGLAYMYLGDANFHLGNLAQRQDDKPGAKKYFGLARDNYGFCIDQGSKFPLDSYLNDQVINGACRPRQASVHAALNAIP